MRRQRLNKFDLKAIHKEKLRAQFNEYLISLGRNVNFTRDRFTQELATEMGTLCDNLMKEFPDLRFYMKRNKECGILVHDKLVNGQIQVCVVCPGLVDEAMNKDSVDRLKALGIE